MTVVVDRLGFATFIGKGLTLFVQLGHIAAVTVGKDGAELLVSGRWLPIAHTTQDVHDALAAWYNANSPQDSAPVERDWLEPADTVPAEPLPMDHPASSDIEAWLANERGALFPWQKAHNGFKAALSRLWDTAQARRSSLTLTGGHVVNWAVKGAMNELGDDKTEVRGEFTFARLNEVIKRAIQMAYDAGCDVADAAPDAAATSSETPSSAWSRGWRNCALAMTAAASASYTNVPPYCDHDYNTETGVLHEEAQ